MTKSESVKQIGSIFLSGQQSYTLIIPKPTAQKYFDGPGKVVLEERDDGILIRKLEY